MKSAGCVRDAHRWRGDGAQCFDRPSAQHRWAHFQSLDQAGIRQLAALSPDEGGGRPRTTGLCGGGGSATISRQQQQQQQQQAPPGPEDSGCRCLPQCHPALGARLIRVAMASQSGDVLKMHNLMPRKMSAIITASIITPSGILRCANALVDEPLSSGSGGQRGVQLKCLRLKKWRSANADSVGRTAEAASGSAVASLRRKAQRSGASRRRADPELVAPAVAGKEELIRRDGRCHEARAPRSSARSRGKLPKRPRDGGLKVRCKPQNQSSAPGRSLRTRWQTWRSRRGTLQAQLGEDRRAVEGSLDTAVAAGAAVASGDRPCHRRSDLVARGCVAPDAVRRRSGAERCRGRCAAALAAASGGRFGPPPGGAGDSDRRHCDRVGAGCHGGAFAPCRCRTCRTSRSSALRSRR